MPLLVWQVDALQSYNVISCCIVQYGGIYGVGQGRLVLSDKNSRNYVVYQGTPSGVPWSFYISDGCRFGVGT